MSDQEYRTKSGRVLTDADIEALADEAEQGYDVSQLPPMSERRREANRRLLARARDLARERGFTDPYGVDYVEYERAKSEDAEYQRLDADLRRLREENA